MPSCLLDLPPEERDKKGITGILSLFSLVSLRAFVNFRTCNPLAHVFHLARTVPVWDVFNEKGMLAGFFVRG